MSGKADSKPRRFTIKQPKPAANEVRAQVLAEPEAPV